MNLYKVTYERKTTGSYWSYASEILQARGLMHAQKLATDHLKELRKNADLPMRINRIIQVTKLTE